MDAGVISVGRFVRILINQGWDEYCPAGKCQWQMPEDDGVANYFENHLCGEYWHLWIKECLKTKKYKIVIKTFAYINSSTCIYSYIQDKLCD